MVGLSMELFVKWTLTGNQVMIGLAALATGVAVIGVGMRLYINNRAQQLQNTNADTNGRKHEDIEIYQHSTSLRLVGAISAITLVAIILAWTQWDGDNSLAAGNLETPEELLMEVPLVVPEPPKMKEPAPPPPPSDKIEITDDNIEEPDNIDKTEDPVEVFDPNNDTGKSGNGELTIPKPKPVDIEPAPVEVEKDLVFAEQMPRFPGCENMKGTDAEKKACADKSLMEFIYKNIKYPTMALEAGIEGTVHLTFVVAKDGTVEKIEILRDPGAGLGKEAARVVNKMNEMNLRWTPGMQGGRPVRVKFNLPVKFKLAK